MSYRPRKDYPYWMINSRFEIKQAINNGSKKNNDRIRAGNCFAKKEQAEEVLDAIKKRPSQMTRWQHLRKAIFA